MTVTPAYVPDPSQTPAQVQARATALGVGVGPATQAPSWAPYVTQTPGVLAFGGNLVVYLHDDGTLTAGQVTTAIAPLIAAAAAQAQWNPNQQAIVTKAQALVAQGEQAFGNWGALSAAQKDAVAKEVVQAVTYLIRLALQLFDTPGV